MNHSNTTIQKECDKQLVTLENQIQNLMRKNARLKNIVESNSKEASAMREIKVNAGRTNQVKQNITKLKKNNGMKINNSSKSVFFSNRSDNNQYQYDSSFLSDRYLSWTVLVYFYSKSIQQHSCTGTLENFHYQNNYIQINWF